MTALPTALASTDHNQCATFENPFSVIENMRHDRVCEPALWMRFMLVLDETEKEAERHKDPHVSFFL